MATNTTVTVGQRGAHGIVLSAATVDTVTIQRDLSAIEVTSMDGVAAIYFTVDGSTPTVGGAACYMLPAAVCSRVVPAPRTEDSTVVKLISAGTPTYSVQDAG